MAALPASLPRTTLSASSRCHSRLIPGLDGNSVLIDTRLHSLSPKHLGYRTERRIVKCRVARQLALQARNAWSNNPGSADNRGWALLARRRTVLHGSRTKQV